MADEDADTKANKAKGKPKTAVDGNAPGGPDFDSADGAKASGSGAVLGKQVKPETQTNEADGNRTLANPVTDPGPVTDHDWKQPDTSQGETIQSVNKPLDILQRHSTDPNWAAKGDNVMTTQMAPDLLGAHSIASDVYNPEKGEGLTDMAKKKSMQEREVAPMQETGSSTDTVGPVA